MNFKIAIIGAKDAIIGFSALGVTPHECYETKAAIEILKNIKSERNKNDEPTYAIVLITEDLISTIPLDEYKKITKEALPAIISIPGIRGSKGFGEKKVRRMIEQAIGSDIFGDN